MDKSISNCFIFQMKHYGPARINSKIKKTWVLKLELFNRVVKIQDPYVLLLRSYQNLDKRDCDWQEAKYVLSYFGKGVL